MIQETGSQIRYFYPGPSELFGNQSPPQNEDTPFDPQSPYAEAKKIAVEEVRHFRDSYDMHASVALLFNHGSERRTAERTEDPLEIEGKFIERKIALLAAKLDNHMSVKGKFGNIHAIRDIGYSPEYVKAIFAMVQQDSPTEFAIGTGKVYSIEELLKYALWWLGPDWKNYVEIDPTLFRPNEVDALTADPQKIVSELGFTAEKDEKDVIKIIFEHDKRYIRFLLRETIGKQVEDHIMPSYLSVFNNVLYTFTQEYLTKHELLDGKFDVRCKRPVEISGKKEVVDMQYESLPDSDRLGYYLALTFQGEQVAIMWEKEFQDYIIFANGESNTQEAVNTAHVLLEKVKKIPFVGESLFGKLEEASFTKSEMDLLGKYNLGVLNLHLRDAEFFHKTFGVALNMNEWLFNKFFILAEAGLDDRKKLSARIKETAQLIDLLSESNHDRNLQKLEEYLQPWL